MLIKIDNLPEPRRETWAYHAAPAFEERYIPGMVYCGVDYTSHRITIYVARDGKMKEGHKRTPSDSGCSVYFKMHHGGGIELYQVRKHIAEACIDEWLKLPDVALYAVFMALYDAAQEARTTGAHLASHRLKKAFVEGRLKKRKQRGANAYEVWVEPEPVVVPAIVAE